MQDAPEHSDRSVRADRTDGRRMRREQSRVAAVDALLDLLARGARVPSAREIADRAGITERTLFNLFDDKSTLLWAAVARFRERALTALPETPSTGSLESRAHRLVSSLAEFFDEYSNVRWAALMQDATVPDMQRGVVLNAVFARFETLLRQEGLDPCDGDLTAALRAAIDPLSWRQLRVHQRLDMDRAARVLTRTVVALMRDAKRR